MKRKTNCPKTNPERLNLLQACPEVYGYGNHTRLTGHRL